MEVIFWISNVLLVISICLIPSYCCCNGSKGGGSSTSSQNSNSHKGQAKNAAEITSSRDIDIFNVGNINKLYEKPAYVNLQSDAVIFVEKASEFLKTDDVMKKSRFIEAEVSVEESKALRVEIMEQKANIRFSSRSDERRKTQIMHGLINFFACLSPKLISAKTTEKITKFGMNPNKQDVVGVLNEMNKIEGSTFSAFLTLLHPGMIAQETLHSQNPSQGMVDHEFAHNIMQAVCDHSRISPLELTYKGGQTHFGFVAIIKSFGDTIIFGKDRRYHEAQNGESIEPIFEPEYPTYIQIGNEDNEGGTRKKSKSKVNAEDAISGESDAKDKGARKSGENSKSKQSAGGHDLSSRKRPDGKSAAETAEGRTPNRGRRTKEKGSAPEPKFEKVGWAKLETRTVNGPIGTRHR